MENSKGFVHDLQIFSLFRYVFAVHALQVSGRRIANPDKTEESLNGEIY